jgi:hypothetical protein
MPISASLKHEIDVIIETTLMLAPKGVQIKELARRAYASERKIFDQAQETWVLDRIIWLLTRKRQTITSVDPTNATSEQYMLPGMERIPRRFTMRNGRRIARENAVLSEVREYRASLLNLITNQRNTLVAKDPTKDPRIVALDKLIELMLRYAKPGKMGVTVGHVISAERKKQS